MKAEGHTCYWRKLMQHLENEMQTFVPILFCTESLLSLSPVAS